MEKALFKLILGILLIANGVFGQDSSGKTTEKYIPICYPSIKRSSYYDGSTPITVMAICSIKKKFPVTVMSHCSISLKSPCGLLPNGNYELCQIKIDSTKPIDTTLINKPIQTLSSFQPYCRICGPSRASVISSEPLYVLKNDNRMLGREIMEQISSKLIESINVLKGEIATAKYGSRAANGVIEITLKENSVFLSVEELLSAYELPKRYGKLPLYINKKFFPKEQLLLSRSSVTDVEIAEELENGVKEKHIEVTTTEKN